MRSIIANNKLKDNGRNIDASLQEEIGSILTKMEAYPEFRADIGGSALASLQGKHDDLSGGIDAFIGSSIEELSDSIPRTTALKNKFFDKWLSDEMMSLEDVGVVLKQYRALTDLTRFAVAVDFIAAHGNNEQEKDYSQNLHEENGGKNGKPHIELLDDFTKALMNLIAGKDIEFSPQAKEGELFESTLVARSLQQSLYSGVTAHEKGIKESLLDGEHPQFVKATIEAVSAAHEGKAPGMLLVLLLGAVKYISASEHVEKNTQVSQFRKYFDDHLGEELVNKALDGRVDLSKVTEALLKENATVNGLSSTERRERGFVEQAHRKDANDATIASILSEGNNVDKLCSFVEAKEGFELFLQAQGAFWDGVADGIDSKNIQSDELEGKDVGKHVKDFLRRAVSRPQISEESDKKGLLQHADPLYKAVDERQRQFRKAKNGVAIKVAER